MASSMVSSSGVGSSTSDGANRSRMKSRRRTRLLSRSASSLSSCWIISGLSVIRSSTPMLSSSLASSSRLTVHAEIVLLRLWICCTIPETNY
nr:MAG TPA: hypothetical protein [Caudoviricetes sp.]